MRTVVVAVVVSTGCAGTSRDPASGAPEPPTGSSPPPGPPPIGPRAPSPPIMPGTTLCGVTAPACATKSFPSAVVDAVKRGGAGFRGTVQPSGAPDPVLPPDDVARALVVRIDRVLTGTSVFTDNAGRNATIVFDAAPQPWPAVGYEGYFFANGLVFGASIVMDRGSLFDPTAYPNLETMVPDIEQTIADRATFERMGKAALVLAGSVGATTALAVDPLRASEHSPLWNEASVTPSCAIKGGADPTVALAVRFAGSRDIAWESSPKLSPGQDAAFILARDDATGVPGAAYLVTDPVDVSPTSTLARLLALLACPPPAL